MAINAVTLEPVTALTPVRQDTAASPEKFAQALLFETFLKGAGLREALAPSSLEGGMFGDFLIQQLAQDLARQVDLPAAGQPYGDKQ